MNESLRSDVFYRHQIHATVEMSLELKFGSFDWIIDFERFRKYLHPSFTNLSSKKEDQNVLVVGCGTSKLSSDLIADGFFNVHSIDNDDGCIAHMSQLHQLDVRLKWYHYDIVERSGSDSSVLSGMQESFDLVVDKGTFDAILVEGSCAAMLIEIWRLLRRNGVYIICSLNSLEFLEKYFSIESIGFSATFHTSECEGGVQTMVGNIVICTKNSTVPMDLEQVLIDERIVMDEHFQQTQPLLSKDFHDIVRRNFICRLTSEGFSSVDDDEETSLLSPLSLRSAHEAMFSSTEFLDYNFALFTEDLIDFPLADPTKISFEEAIRFLQLKQ